MAEEIPVPGNPVQAPLGRCVEFAVKHIVRCHHDICAGQAGGRKVPAAVRAMIQRGMQLRRLLIDLVNPLLRLCMQNSGLSACVRPLQHECAACQPQMTIWLPVASMCAFAALLARRQMGMTMQQRRRQGWGAYNTQRADHKGALCNAPICAVYAGRPELVLPNRQRHPVQSDAPTHWLDRQMLITSSSCALRSWRAQPSMWPRRHTTLEASA